MVLPAMIRSSPGLRFTGPTAGAGQTVILANINPRPARVCNKVIARSIQEKFLTAAGLFFRTERLCQRWTPEALCEIERLRADWGGRITNATRSSSISFLRPKARL